MEDTLDIAAQTKLWFRTLLEKQNRNQSRVTRARAFSCACRPLYVITLNSDRFTELSSSSPVIGQSKCFGFGFPTLNWKPLQCKCYLVFATELCGLSVSSAGFLGSSESSAFPSTIDNISRIRRSWSTKNDTNNDKFNNDSLGLSHDVVSHFDADRNVSTASVLLVFRRTMVSTGYVVLTSFKRITVYL